MAKKSGKYGQNIGFWTDVPPNPNGPYYWGHFYFLWVWVVLEGRGFRNFTWNCSANHTLMKAAEPNPVSPPSAQSPPAEPNSEPDRYRERKTDNQYRKEQNEKHIVSRASVYTKILEK
eukprot:4484183-Amphidinium_carterae.1